MRKKKYMKEKYGGVLIIFLIILTVYFSVKHEQQRLLGKMELQTEEVILQLGEKTKSIGSDVINDRKKVVIQSGEKIENIGSDAINDQKEAENDKGQIIYKHVLPGAMKFYDSAEEIPYVDEETFELIREAYTEVDYSAEFEKGDMVVYEEYKQAFWRLFHNEISFLDRETGKEIYIKDWTDSDGYSMVSGMESCPYYFFDMSGDGLPELCIDDLGKIIVFAYDSDRDQCILWTLINGMKIVGTRKGVWNPDYDTDIYGFFQLDIDGNLELNTMFFAEHPDRLHENFSINMVMFPNYADREKNWEITEEMMRNGILEENSGQWFFRITDEQFTELEKPFLEALRQVRGKGREVEYTYDELFGKENYFGAN